MGMSENSSGLKTIIILCAVFVAGSLGGAGYAGFLELQKLLARQQEETQRVVVDLGTELTGTIEKSQWKPSGGDSDSDDESQREIRDTLSNLRTMIETLSERQMAINETLGREQQAEEKKPAGDKRTIYFELGKAESEEAATQVTLTLGGLGRYAARPDRAASVNGYADTLGKDASNLALSRERARYVAAKVRDAGIRVASVEAWGERRLETHTFDGVGLQNNRRVEIEVTCEGPETGIAAATS